jgi:hypothetical protein
MDIGYYILMIILMGLGLVAAYLIPTKQDLMKGGKEGALSPRFTFVYIIGLFICIIFIYFLITTLINMERELLIPVLVNLILSGIIGIGLLLENHNRSNLKTKLEVEGRVDVSGTEVEVQEVKGETSDSKTKAGPQVIKCPKCSKHIRITDPSRPLQIACPHCGVKGEIR